MIGMRNGRELSGKGASENDLGNRNVGKTLKLLNKKCRFEFTNHAVSVATMVESTLERGYF